MIGIRACLHSAAISRCRWGWSLAVLSIWMAGCRSVPPAETQPPLGWPPPPAPARVEFVRSVGAPRDLGVSPVLWQKALNALTGSTRGSDPWVCPFGVWLGKGGDLCFTDSARGEVIFVDSAARNLWRWDRVGTNRLQCPVGVACVSGLVYVADSELGLVLIADPKGQPRGVLAHPFQRPVAVAARAGRVYVADAQACCVQVFTASGNWLQTIGRSGSGDGELNRPTHVAADRDGSIYVTDSLNSRVQVFDSAGRFVFAIGRPGDSRGHFGRPKGVAVDDAGHVFVVDGIFGVVQIFDSKGRLLLDFGEPGQDPGQFWLPSGIAVNAEGLMAVADSYNHRLQLFRLVPEATGSFPSTGRAQGGER